jgi:hypothetical protein
MKAERIFQVIAVILAGIAAYFLWTKNNDGAFVSAVLGCVSFFLSVRFQVKERNQARDAERVSSNDESELPSEEVDRR